MYGKALPVGVDWGSFSVEKSATFQQFPPGFQHTLRKNRKRSVEKRFLQENCVENAGKTVEYPFFAEKLVENHPFFIRCTAN